MTTCTVSTVTINTVTYDVYGTTVELSDYMGGKLSTTAFDTATDEDKDKAHVEATRWIDRERWQGTPTDLVTPQPLQHPRVGLIDCNGTPIPDDELALGICNGTFELVLLILQKPSVLTKGSTGSNVKSAKAGSAKVDFFRPGVDASGQTSRVFPTVAYKQVQCFLATGQGASGAAFGTDQESSFCDPDRDGLTQGLF